MSERKKSPEQVAAYFAPSRWHPIKRRRFVRLVVDYARPGIEMWPPPSLQENEE